jgi:hypothetical protein
MGTPTTPQPDAGIPRKHDVLLWRAVLEHGPALLATAREYAARAGQGFLWQRITAGGDRRGQPRYTPLARLITDAEPAPDDAAADPYIAALAAYDPRRAAIVVLEREDDTRQAFRLRAGKAPQPLGPTIHPTEALRAARQALGVAAGPLGIPVAVVVLDPVVGAVIGADLLAVAAAVDLVAPLGDGLPEEFAALRAACEPGRDGLALVVDQRPQRPITAHRLRR